MVQYKIYSAPLQIFVGDLPNFAQKMSQKNFQLWGTAVAPPVKISKNEPPMHFSVQFTVQRRKNRIEIP